MKTLKPLKWAATTSGALVILFGAARSGRPDHAYPSTERSHTTQAYLVGSTRLDSVLARACGDCHSNSVSSGWPFSWLIARGAREGRKAVNFAEWSTYTPEQQRTFLLASCTDAKLGKMPVKASVRFRPDAQLSTQDVETICSAARPVEQTSAASAARQTGREP